MTPWARLRAGWAHAFAVRPDGTGGLSDEERDLVERLAAFVVRRRLTAAAILLLETGRPLNFVGSQLLAFLSPVLTLIFSRPDCERLVRLLDRRASIDHLVTAIEAREAAHRGA